MKSLKHPKCAIFILCILYLMLIWHYSVNIPRWDDYDALIQGIMSLTAAHHFKDFMMVLIAQQNEHRIATTRLIAYIQYCLTGHLNFKGLILIANLFKIGSLLILLSPLRQKIGLILPLVLCLFFFQLCDAESAFWAMAGLGAYTVIFFSLVSLYFLQQVLYKKRRFYFLLACLSSLLATFSMGNGLLIFFAGSLMLLLHKAYKYFVLYALMGALSLFAYFYHFHYIGGVRTDNPFILLHYLLIFLGNITSKESTAVCLGSFGMIVFLYLVYKNNALSSLKSNFLFYFILFIFMTAVVCGIDRAAWLGIDSALTFRYSIYSILFFSILIILWVNEKQRLHFVFYILLIVCSILHIHAGIHYQKAQAHTLTSYHVQSPNEITNLNYPDQTRANQLIQTAAAMKFYSLPVSS